MKAYLYLEVDTLKVGKMLQLLVAGCGNGYSKRQKAWAITYIVYRRSKLKAEAGRVHHARKGIIFKALTNPSNPWNDDGG